MDVDFQVVVAMFWWLMSPTFGRLIYVLLYMLPRMCYGKTRAILEVQGFVVCAGITTASTIPIWTGSVHWYNIVLVCVGGICCVYTLFQENILCKVDCHLPSRV
jgi:hypothetical protein